MIYNISMASFDIVNKIDMEAFKNSVDAVNTIEHILMHLDLNLQLAG